MDSILASKLDSMSTEMGLSKNKLIKMLLSKALGINKQTKPSVNISMIAFTLNDVEAAHLLKSTSDFNDIDEADWI